MGYGVFVSLTDRKNDGFLAKKICREILISEKIVIKNGASMTPAIYYADRNKKLRESIDKYTEFLPKNSNAGEKVYVFFNNFFKTPICRYCKKKNRRYVNFSKGYGKFCSRSCQSMGYRKLDFSEIETIKKLYHDGKTLNELSKIYKVSKRTIVNYMDIGNIKRRTVSESKTMVLDENECENVIDKYINQKMSMEDITNDTNIPRHKVRTILLRKKIKIRNHKEYSSLEGWQKKRKAISLDKDGLNYSYNTKKINISISKERLNFLYTTKKLGCTKIAEILGIPHGPVLELLKKYNIPMKTSEEKQKCREQGTMEKHGVKNYMSHKDFYKKSRQSLMKNLGVENPCHDPNVLKKARATCIARYGVPYVAQSPLIQQRIQRTCMARYGVPSVMLLPEIKQKIRESFEKNGTVKTSKQQLSIFEMLKKANYNVTLNAPASPFSLDTLVLLENEIKVDLEYDGGGHFVWDTEEEKSQKDIKRDKVLQSKGYKIFRIESRKDKLPTLEQIQEGLTKLTTGDRKFLRIKLS